MKAEDKPNRQASLNRHSLVDAMAKQPDYHFNKRDTYDVIDVMLRVMKRHLNHRGAVKLATFGTFRLLYHAPRVVHNPRKRGTGRQAQINVKGHYALNFKPSRQWYARIKQVKKP